MRYFLILFFLVMFGNQAPKIPHNETLGLRISWTLDDEATWKYAHRIIGYLTFPCVVLMIVCYGLGYQQVGYMMLLPYIILPSILSYQFYKKQGWVLTETTAAYRSIWFIPIMHSFLDVILYSYLPDDFPMQFSNLGKVNYTWPKPYALAVMILVEIGLILYARGGSAKRLWVIVTSIFLMFMVTTAYILMNF